MPRATNYYAGVDPGYSSGGLCLLRNARIERLEPIPETERDIYTWFTSLPASTIVAIEWIHPAIQGTGKSQMSKLYGSYKQLRMAIIAANLRLEEFKPQRWQRGLGVSARRGLPTTKWKNLLKARAQELFPKTNITLRTADALLIAEYNRQVHSMANGYIRD